MRQLLDIKNKGKSVRGLRLLPFYLITFLLLSTFSCSTIDCPVQNVVGAIYIVKLDGGVDAVLPDTLTVLSWRKDRTDTLLLNHESALTSFRLPMGFVNPEDSLVFIVTSPTYTLKDMLYIKKENQPHFESVDCNIAYFHQITGIRLSSHNAIDSISIVKSAVNYDLSSEHFHIYFKTATKRE